jgi:hypothetical protein
MKNIFAVVGVLICGTLSFAQTGDTVSVAQLKSEWRNPDLMARWQQNPAAGQTGGAAGGASTKVVSDHPWELDFHIGAAIHPRSTGGTGLLPTSTTNSTTSSDLLQPSFFFGSGAVQASAVSTSNGFSAIAPFDAALTTDQAQRKNGFAFGFRLGKDLNRWVGLEYTLDFNFTPLQLSSFAKNLASTSASSAQAAISPLVAMTGGVANAQALIGSEGGKQVFNILSANLYLRPSDSKWRPYISIGGGILNNTGSDPSVDLLNTIQLGGNTVTEADLLSVRYEPQRIAGVVEYGTGLKHFFNEHWGLRLDLRDNMAWESLRTKIFAFANPPTGGSSSFLFSGNGRSIAFSNDQSTLQSTLSTSVNGATTFTSSGVQHHVNASAGIVFRF